MREARVPTLFATIALALAGCCFTACGTTQSSLLKSTGGGSFERKLSGNASSAEAALREAMQVQRSGRRASAIRHFRRVAVKWPESPEAVMALNQMAGLQAQEDAIDGFNTYQVLIDRHAGRFDFEQVLENQMALATRVQGTRTGMARIVPGLHNQSRAIPLFKQIIANAPAWSRAPEAQYRIGIIEQSRGNRVEAIDAYRRVMEEYASSKYAELASFYQAESYYEIAMGRATDREVEEATVHLGRFLEKYPGSDFTETAFEYKKAAYEKLANSSYQVALYYDKKLEKPESALVAYREFVKRFPSSAHFRTAQARIQELSQVTDVNTDVTP